MGAADPIITLCFESTTDYYLEESSQPSLCNSVQDFNGRQNPAEDLDCLCPSSLASERKVELDCWDRAAG